MYLLLYILISTSMSYEDTDHWQGPTNYLEFLEFHKIDKIRIENKMETVVCKYSLDGEVYFCYTIEN